MDYAKLLSAYIEKSELSLRRIAELCNKKGFSIDHSYISKLKNGKMPPPSEELSRVLAEVLGGDPETLVIEGYIEKAPEEIKKLLSAKSIECGIDVNTPFVFAETPEDKNSYIQQRPGRVTRPKYSMIVELADLIENKNIQITAGGEPLTQEQRLFIGRTLLELPIGTGKTSSIKGLLEENLDKDFLIVTNRNPNTIPLLGNIRAGIPLLSEQNIIGHINIPADLVGKADFALNVQGDSMIGAGINSGDVAICKENHEAISGQIVVALVNNDETTLKYYIRENGQAFLRAANPEYKDIELKPSDQIQGNVVKIIKDPPPVNTYREFIYFKEWHLQEWNKVVEKAAAAGIKPTVIVEMINAQIEIAKRLTDK